MTPLQRYQHDIEHAGFIQDANQHKAIEQLENLCKRLVVAERKHNHFISGLLRQCGFGKRAPEQGLYLWGSVGRGKTYLMDIFYESLPFNRKMRLHFHRFMRQVHNALKSLAQQKNPLTKVAQHLAAQARIICLDEFFVNDITDAMLLAGLLDGLFQQGVCLVVTSNVAPDALYRDGLQRARFLPAIALLKQHTAVMNIAGDTDYRLRILTQTELYHCPLGAAADSRLYHSFLDLAPDTHDIVEGLALAIGGRTIHARYHAQDVVWFDFDALCDGPRSQNDYIDIAMEYHEVLLSNIPELTQKKEDQARRFIHLVDEFYDRNVKLIISAAKPINALYSGTRLRFEFERTKSRLVEMQSHEYLAKPHKL